MLITFEGIEGVGKTTLAKLFHDELVKQYGLCKVILTKQPGGTPFGMRIREILLSEPNIDLQTQFYLVEAQRHHHVETLFKPNKDKIIICDRYIDSSYVYQHDLLSEDQWDEYISKKYPYPDITFFL